LIEETEKEEWRIVPGFDLYEASSFGRIRNTKTYKILKPAMKKYPIVALSVSGRMKTKRLHMLIALTYLGKRPPETETHHKDLNPQNFYLSNIEYLDHHEHRRRHVRHERDTINPYAKLNETQVKQILDLYNKGYTKTSLAIQFKVSARNIYKICYGYTWKYLKVAQALPGIAEVREPGSKKGVVCLTKGE